MRIARRIASLPPYLFAELDRKLAAKRAEGVDVISLGVGDPDMPTPEHVVAAMREAVGDTATHRYPGYYGSPRFRVAVAAWYRRRFGVELDPETEVIALIGSKEGIGHIAFAMLDPGDEALVPDPGYAAYGEITFDGYVAPSPLQVAGAKEVTLEFGSASKLFNMTGWRIGWAAGSAEAIRALAVVKTNLDSGQFTAIQRATIAALEG